MTVTPSRYLRRVLHDELSWFCAKFIEVRRQTGKLSRNQPGHMDTDIAQISARSQRQAMDWSLVLVSQGIESTIDQAPDGSGWILLVPARDFHSAVTAIRHYRQENRRWGWRRQLLQSGLLFDWSSLAWIFLLFVFYWADAASGFRTAGTVDSTAVSHGQWWRLFTGVWLHADLAHLAANATFGLVLSGLAMGRFGPGAGLLAAYLAGVAGNVLACLLDSEPHHSLGASGMVMGCLGLLAVQAFWLWRLGQPGRRHLITGAAAGLMLFILLGLTPGTDILAHSGGFAFGCVFGAGLALVPDIPDRTRLNFICGAIFVLLVLIPWGLALAHKENGVL
jgi:membrane associated rhomboid family serine protease